MNLPTYCKFIRSTGYARPTIGGPMDVRNGFAETRCVRHRWVQQKAKLKGHKQHRACPATAPVRGAPCHGAGECDYASCMTTDDAGLPVSFNPFFPRWVCYQGGWRRYDVRCIGE